MEPVFVQQFDELMDLVEDVKADHEKAWTKKNKSAARRARTKLGAIRKKIAEYRKSSTLYFSV